MSKELDRQNGKECKLPLAPKRLLIADDEMLQATRLVQQLAEIEMVAVGPCADGADALLAARADQPDMALLDIRMPKVDGLSVARQIYSELGIPSVMVTAYSEDEYLKATVDGGVFGYVIKPTELAQLRATITVAWARYRELAMSRAEEASLRKRLEERKIVEQAKWIIVQRRSIDEGEALRMLQKQARDSRQALAEVAQSVIRAEAIL